MESYYLGMEIGLFPQKSEHTEYLPDVFILPGITGYLLFSGCGGALCRTMIKTTCLSTSWKSGTLEMAAHIRTLFVYKLFFLFTNCFFLIVLNLNVSIYRIKL